MRAQAGLFKGIICNISGLPRLRSIEIARDWLRLLELVRDEKMPVSLRAACAARALHGRGEAGTASARSQVSVRLQVACAPACNLWR